MGWSPPGITWQSTKGVCTVKRGTTFVLLVPLAVVLLSACEGKHVNAQITCRQENVSVGGSVLGNGIQGGGTYWVCTVIYIAETGDLHTHELTDDEKYANPSIACKDRGQILVADVTVEKKKLGRGGATTEEVTVGDMSCMDPPDSP